MDRLVITSKLAQLVRNYKEDGPTKTVSLSWFIEYARGFIKQAMLIVNGLVDNAEKKRLVLEYAGKLYDVFEPLIKVRYPWLNWLFILIGGDNGMKDEFLQAVTVLIEVIWIEDIKNLSN